MDWCCIDSIYDLNERLEAFNMELPALFDVHAPVIIKQIIRLKNNSLKKNKNGYQANISVSQVHQDPLDDLTS